MSNQNVQVPSVSKALELLTKEGVGVGPSEAGADDYFIVYLDDEAEILEPVVVMAAEFGLKCYATTSVLAALEFIEKQQHRIVYIISDYKMPTENGFEFRVKAAAIAPDVPFAILSANITKELALKGIELKISAFFNKPITAIQF